MGTESGEYIVVVLESVNERVVDSCAIVGGSGYALGGSVVEDVASSLEDVRLYLVGDVEVAVVDVEKSVSKETVVEGDAMVEEVGDGRAVVGVRRYAP